MKGYGGFSSIAIGCLYLLTVLMILLSPPGANSVVDHVDHSTYLTLAHYFLGFIGFFGIAVVQVSSSFLYKRHDFLEYTKILSIVGFGLLSINNFRQIGLDHLLAHEAFHKSGEYLDYTVFFWRGLVEFSPQGWVDFGFVGFWLVVLNYTYLRNKTINKYLSLIGLLLGCLFITTVVGNVIGVQTLTLIGMGLGGFVLAPIYFIWLGIRILQSSFPVKVPNPQ